MSWRVVRPAEMLWRGVTSPVWADFSEVVLSAMMCGEPGHEGNEARSGRLGAQGLALGTGFAVREHSFGHLCTRIGWRM